MFWANRKFAYTFMALTISEIWIYPVKSFGGIQLDSCTVFPKGIEYDRRWMLIDKNNSFLTQRSHPELSTFRLSTSGNNFNIRFKDEILTLPHQAIGKKMIANIFDDQVEVIEVESRISEWFCDHLGITCRLVWFPEHAERQVDPRYANPGDHVSLADAYPLLVIGQSSLDDLNSKMEHALPMNRFRPNIVFVGGKPFEEDEWKNFGIGDCKFRAVKPCARCVIPTIDQETGQKGFEPTATLATYRKAGNKIMFGQNLIVIQAGTIATGNEIRFQ
jgi:uncharacterized protein YcbX